MNDDKTISLAPVDPTMNGWLAFMIGEREAKRVLVFPDRHHE